MTFALMPFSIYTRTRSEDKITLQNIQVRPGQAGRGQPDLHRGRQRAHYQEPQEPGRDGGALLRPLLLRRRGDRDGGQVTPRGRQTRQAKHPHRTLRRRWDLHRLVFA